MYNYASGTNKWDVRNIYKERKGPHLDKIRVLEYDKIRVCYKENRMIRVMKIADYDEVRSLWMKIRGFGIRSIDDSREEVARFLRRNPTTSVVAEEDGRIVGAILCGHDGRQGTFYHVCVEEQYRMRGIGKAMVLACMEALRAEKINKVTLIAFSKNDIGNAFWKKIGWTRREDLNYYEFILNEENITAFIQ